jgi:hypothetical protein
MLDQQKSHYGRHYGKIAQSFAQTAKNFTVHS